MSTESLYEIYCFTNTVNNKKYVGQTKMTLERRWYKHKYDALVGLREGAFQEAIRKHGEAAFRGSVLESGLSSSDVDARETFWIAELNTTNAEFGYNRTTGGNTRHQVKLSPEACEKIRQSKLGKQLTGRRARTQAEDLPIVEAFKAGKSMPQIVTELGFTYAKVQKALWRWKERVEPDLQVGGDFAAGRKMSGLSLQKRAAELNLPITDRWDAGQRICDIARELDLPYDRVKQVVIRHRKRLQSVS